MTRLTKSALVGGVLALFAVAALADEQVEIPYTKFVLDNGLTVIVHEDDKAPIVAVNLWYHVGSKNELTGKTGFAHLFEHLMFNGTENYNDEYFKPFDRVGATDMNGTTNFDRTNYFQNVPTTGLDLALWMESDRMGHLLGAVDDARLNEQRDVVKNEKRQGENQPYGKVYNVIFENVHPKGHPYSWMPIGSMEDLDAASLEDVHGWFQTYYGPNNAVLVLAGNIDPETARAKAEQYFGHIPPGPPLTKPGVAIPEYATPRRAVMEDRVPQARVYKVWNIPQWGSEAGDELQLVASILGGGKNSRLYERLVYEDQIATDVAVFPYLGEVSGVFVIQATAQPGQDLAAVERAIDEELALFIAKGPTSKELERVKTQSRAAFVRGVERVGGFGGKSDILAENEVYGGSPDHYKITRSRIENATAKQLRAVAEEWLDEGVFVLEVHPYEEFATVASNVERADGPPIPDEFPSPDFPAFQTAELSNGLKLILVERDAIPVVDFNLLLDAGFAADQFGVPGTASLAMNMLDEGTQQRSALEISEELALLGASLGTGSNLDHSAVTLSALKENIDESLEIYADVILDPAFPDDEFERLRKQQLAAIQREKVTPLSMALRVFPQLLYGEGHAYSIPLTGSGTEESVTSLSTEKLAEFHETWFKPNNATLIVVGDISLEEVTPKLEKLFANWKPGEVPRKNVAEVAEKQASTVYLVDRPGSEQSMIFAGHIAPPKANPDEIAIEAANDVLGGNFTSRINMNLREEKNWTYGARSVIVGAQGQRPFIVYAPVQSDKTKDAMAEIQRELTGVVGDRPPSDEEVAIVKDKNTLTLPGRWETNGAIMGSLTEMVRFGYPDDYWQNYPTEVGALNVDEVTSAARAVIHPDRLVWVVVGDREKIESGIRELELGEIRFLDADGKPVESVAGL